MFKIFPNPVREQLTITGSCLKGEKAGLRIFDLSGRAVFEKNLDTQASHIDAKIDVSTLADGIYIAEVNGGNGVYRSKLVKE